MESADRSGGLIDFVGLESLENACDRLTLTDAHRRDAVARLAPVELVQQRRSDACAGRAERMAERDATPVRVHVARDPALVEPNGGGISLGHPLGATGARITATLLNELDRRGARYGIATMCIGQGQAIAGVLERL